MEETKMNSYMFHFAAAGYDERAFDLAGLLDKDLKDLGVSLEDATNNSSNSNHPTEKTFNVVLFVMTFFVVKILNKFKKINITHLNCLCIKFNYGHPRRV